jgi:hypothetical protein
MIGTLAVALLAAPSLAAPSLGAQNAPPAAPRARMSAGDSTIVAREAAAWTAFRSRDSAAFARIVTPGWTSVDNGGIAWPTGADMARGMAACDTRSFTIVDPRVSHPTPDVAMLTYTLQMVQTCAGKTTPPTESVLSVWARQNGAWRVIAHAEVPKAGP